LSEGQASSSESPALDETPEEEPGVMEKT